jgi:trehalose 6-phosphate phosphatase
VPVATPQTLNDNQALFLDFDGTLVDIAPAPDRVVVDPLLTRALERLLERLRGAVALVSGRPIAQIDRWLAPLTLPCAGVHGAERRTAAGQVRRVPLPDLGAIASALEHWAGEHVGLLVERKGVSVALHYRQAPELRTLCEHKLREVLSQHRGLHLMHGKMVLELLPQGVSKAHAIDAFLSESPFAGRQPLFIGDDVTDEAGFEHVRAAGGVAVKVGPGPSIAERRLEGPAAVRSWLFAAAGLTATPQEDDNNHAPNA